MLHQQLNLRRQVPPLRIHRPHRGVGWLKGRQQGSQGAAGEMFEHIVVGKLAQPETAQRRIENRLAAVAAPLALHPLHDLAPAGLEHPVVGSAHQAVVMGELGEAVGRTVALEIGWRRAQVHDPRGDTGSDQPRIAETAKPDGEVEAVLEDVAGLVGELDLEAQLRMHGHEFVHQRHHEALAVGHRAGHAQQPLGYPAHVVDDSQRLVVAFLQLTAVLQKGLADLGERNLAGAAIEEPGLQPLLEGGDLAADMGRGHAEPLRRSRKTTTFGDRHESLDTAPPLHPVHCASIVAIWQ